MLFFQGEPGKVHGDSRVVSWIAGSRRKADFEHKEGDG